MNRSAIRRRNCRLKASGEFHSGCYTVGFPLFTHLRIDVENRIITIYLPDYGLPSRMRITHPRRPSGL
jgi:hypothetical protein